MRKLVSSGRPWEDKAGYSRAVRVGPMVEIGLTSPSAPDGSILHAGAVYLPPKACLKIVGEALEQAGCEVTAALCVLDRNEGGSAEVVRRGYSFRSLLSADDKGKVGPAKR